MLESLGQSADPAANTELSLALAQRSNLMAGSFTIVTDSGVANRQIYIVFTDASDVELFRVAAPVVVTASITALITFGKGLITGGIITAQVVQIPNDLILESGYKITTVTTAMEAGDDYGIMSTFGKKVGSTG